MWVLLVLCTAHLVPNFDIDMLWYCLQTVFVLFARALRLAVCRPASTESKAKLRYVDKLRS